MSGGPGRGVGLVAAASGAPVGVGLNGAAADDPPQEAEKAHSRALTDHRATASRTSPVNKPRTIQNCLENVASASPRYDWRSND